MSINYYIPSWRVLNKMLIKIILSITLILALATTSMAQRINPSNGSLLGKGSNPGNEQNGGGNGDSGIINSNSKICDSGIEEIVKRICDGSQKPKCEDGDTCCEQKLQKQKECCEMNPCDIDALTNCIDNVDCI
jgi:hypothetical protein